MKRLTPVLAGASVAVALMFTAGQAQAQGRGGRGGFDPAQMQQRMMENIRDQLGVTDDAEWKVIESRVQKVLEARRELGFGGMGRMMFRRPGGDQGDQGPRRRFGPEPSEAEAALEKAIDAKASTEELKAAMAKLRAERKAKEEALRKAQEELKKVLNTRQEAVALMMGLVN